MSNLVPISTLVRRPNYAAARHLTEALYRLEPHETYKDLTDDRKHRARQSWTIDDGDTFVKLLRVAYELNGVANHLQGVLDAARARGVRTYIEAMEGDGTMLALAADPRPESDAMILQRLGVPAKYSNARQEDFVRTGVDRYVYQGIAAWRKNVGTTDDYVRGLYVYSAINGNGKTTATTALFASLAVPDARKFPKSRLAHWVSAPELFQRLRNALDDDAQGEHGMEVFKNVERLSKVPILLIDDLGKERPTEWVQEQFHRIMEARHKTLTTLITSNFSPDKIEARLGKAIGSRIADGFRKFEFKAPDYRKTTGAII